MCGVTRTKVYCGCDISTSKLIALIRTETRLLQTALPGKASLLIVYILLQNGKINVNSAVVRPRCCLYSDSGL